MQQYIVRKYQNLIRYCHDDYFDDRFLKDFEVFFTICQL